MSEKVSKERASELWEQKGGVEGYLKWKEIFSPDSALEYQLK
jgi:hypothetical protein